MERGGGSSWEYGENFVEAFSRPLLIKDIPDKVERFCRTMERGGGGGLGGGRRGYVGGGGLTAARR